MSEQREEEEGLTSDEKGAEEMREKSLRKRM